VLSTLRYFRQEYQAACRQPSQCLDTPELGR